MRDERLHDAIPRRRSVRRYDMAPLPKEVLDGVLAFARAAVPLDPSLRTDVAIQDAGHVRDPLAIRAPHYLCLFSETRGPFLMNAGHLLQQVDLHLSASGLGACWLGLARPHGPETAVERRNGLAFVVMLAFGRPAGPLHRSGPEAFDRLPLAELADLPSFAAAGLPDAETLLQPLRLAPSATNSQPWRVSAFRDDRGAGIRLGRERLNPVKEAFLGRMNRIDAGIGLLHLELSLGRLGIPYAVETLPEHGADAGWAPAGTLPMARIRLGGNAAC